MHSQSHFLDALKIPSSLLRLSPILAIPIIVRTVSTIAMAQIPTTPSPADAIQAAAKANERIFWVSVIVLIIVTVMTVWLRKSDAALQGLVQKDADAKIGLAKAEGETARADAAKANEAAKSAEMRAKEADARGQEAQKQASLANERAEGLELARAKIESDNLELKRNLVSAEERIASLNLKAEELHKENLALEETLSPRFFFHQDAAIESLKRFEGTKVVIKYLNDLECKHTAEQIAFVLVEAHWKIVAAEPAGDMVIPRDGVTIEIGFLDPPPPKINLKDGVFEQLTAALTAGRISNYVRNVVFDETNDTVVILVGLRPVPKLKHFSNEISRESNAPNRINGNRRLLPIPRNGPPQAPFIQPAK